MESTPKVIKIPAKISPEAQAQNCRQIRVAAYCRVSTKEEDQANSYEAQKEYYTDKIMKNPAWSMAGIFADKGITGTSAKKRGEFMRMIKHCRQKKIDVILTKSVSRFSRNTVDCLYYIRALKALGIAVIFEKENINSLEEDSEMRITLSGAFAQSESESISANVTWGVRRAMEAGKVSFNYKRIYGYRRGPDGKPEIVPEHAEVIRQIYDSYLAGASLRGIRDALKTGKIPVTEDLPNWTLQRVRNVLKNEKYCGDVLLQKTFRQDFINRKRIKNTGQLPMYLIKNHHPGIVTHEQFQAVQAETARRNAIKASSKYASTGLSCYASKYALSERLFCGECGTRYRRCTWMRHDEKRIVWRCNSRLDYGKRYCHHSPTMNESTIQKTILAAINSAMSDKAVLIQQITKAMASELVQVPGTSTSLGDIDRRLAELAIQFQCLLEQAANDPLAYGDRFKKIMDEQTVLKKQRAAALAADKNLEQAGQRVKEGSQLQGKSSAIITKWDESAIRQLVESVKVVSKEQLLVTLKDGVQIQQSVIE